MRSIVVAVNFTPNSSNAARYAADMALTIGVDICLIYVFHIPMTVSGVPMPEPVFEEKLDSGLVMLNDLKTELIERTSGKVAITTDIETGGVEYRIQKFCKEQKPLLLVMGATGESFQHVLLGGATLKALRHLRFPILVVPGGAKFHAIRKIGVACDKEDIDGGMSGTLPLLNELSGLLGARLQVFHVLTDGEKSASESMKEYNVWKKEGPTLNPQMHFIRQPRVDEGINEYLKGHRADWLMVFPKSHSVLEFHCSKAKQIVKNCPVPVMSVHE